MFSKTIKNAKDGKISGAAAPQGAYFLLEVGEKVAADTGNHKAYNQKVALDARSRRVRGDSKPTTRFFMAADVASSVLPTATRRKIGAVAVGDGGDDGEGAQPDRKTMIANRSHQKQVRFKLQKHQQRENDTDTERTQVVVDDIEAGEEPSSMQSPENFGTSGEEPDVEVPSSREEEEDDDDDDEDDEYSDIEIASPTADYTTPVGGPEIDIPGAKLIEAYTVKELPEDESIIHVAEPVDMTKQWRKMTAGGFFLCLLAVAITVGLTVPLSRREIVVELSEMPSAAPSESPSASPSISQQPSSQPSNLPTVAPTADFCGLQIPLNLTCTEQTTGMDCNDYQNQWYKNLPVLERCHSDPIDLEWNYNPGPCNRSWTYTGDRVDCVDYNGGPSQEEGKIVRVQIVSATVPGLVYYNSRLAPFHRDTSFTISHPRLEPIADMLNVSIYESESGPSSETLVQSVQFPWYCKLGKGQLLDRYGALSPFSFTSVEQGHQSAFANFSGSFRMVLTFDIQNVGVTDVLLESITVATNFGPYYYFNFTDAMPPEMLLQAGESFTPPSFMGERVITSNETYAALITVTGHNEGNILCRTTILPNLTLDSSISLDSSGSFHILPQESHVEEDYAVANEVCKTKADLRCVGRTVSGSVSCDDILRFPGTYPSQIQFKLQKGGCTNDKSNGVNTCNDKFGGVKGGDKAYAVLVQLPGGEVVFDGEVAMGENLDLTSKYGLGPYLDVAVSSSGHYVSQEQRIWTNDVKTFVTGEKFGALLLTSVGTSQSERPLASVNLHVSIENQGNVNSNITSAVITRKPEDIGTELVENPGILSLSPSESTNFGFLSVRVDDWLDHYKSNMAWAARVSGVAANGSPCQDSTTVDFSALS